MNDVARRVLGVLAEARIPLDPVHIAERGGLLPADVDTALAQLVRSDHARRVPAGPRRRTRYLLEAR